MWLIKLPFRIMALPIMLLIGAITIFYKVLLHLGSLVVGLGFLVLGITAFLCLWEHQFINATVLVGTCAVVFLGVMCAEAISLGLEALTGKLCGFIFS